MKFKACTTNEYRYSTFLLYTCTDPWSSKAAIVPTQKKTKKSSQIRLKRKGKTLKDTTLRKNEFTFGKIHREYGIFVTGYLSRANVEQILLQILCQIDGPIRLEVTKRPDCLKKSPGGRLGILAIAIHFLHICSNPSITATLQSCRNSGITLNLGFAKLGEFDLMGGFCER